ncbi:hypothetical protein GOV14_00085 [Candidatus Pacearchaeota archaeon]|nr:hypothetical protein [Candidatus Pacearchaeota archaeon]
MIKQNKDKVKKRSAILTILAISIILIVAIQPVSAAWYSPFTNWLKDFFGSSSDALDEEVGELASYSPSGGSGDNGKGVYSACYVNQECGAERNYDYCSADLTQVVHDRLIPTCLNPGRLSAYCKDMTYRRTEDCEAGCSRGKCKTVFPPSCGDGKCNGDEVRNTCPIDCKEEEEEPEEPLPECIQKTCNELGRDCGIGIDNCDNEIDCGITCPTGKTCNQVTGKCEFLEDIEEIERVGIDLCGPEAFRLNGNCWYVAGAWQTCSEFCAIRNHNGCDETAMNGFKDKDCKVCNGINPEAKCDAIGSGNYGAPYYNEGAVNYQCNSGVGTSTCDTEAHSVRKRICPCRDDKGTCGDGICKGTETKVNCAVDCLSGYCEDNDDCEEETEVCDYSEEYGENKICMEQDCYGRDAQCPEGYKCMYGGYGHGAICVRGYCYAEEDCQEGYVCGENQRCLKASCEESIDCGEGFFCNIRKTCQESECSQDVDCGERGICEDNMCMRTWCYVDENCPVGYVCEETVCIKEGCKTATCSELGNKECGRFFAGCNEEILCGECFEKYGEGYECNSAGYCEIKECELVEAKFARRPVSKGKEVSLIVEGRNCEGRSVNIQLFEKKQGNWFARMFARIFSVDREIKTENQGLASLTGNVVERVIDETTKLFEKNANKGNQKDREVKIKKLSGITGAIVQEELGPDAVPFIDDTVEVSFNLDDDIEGSDVSEYYFMVALVDDENKIDQDTAINSGTFSASEFEDADKKPSSYYSFNGELAIMDSLSENHLEVFGPELIDGISCTGYLFDGVNDYIAIKELSYGLEDDLIDEEYFKPIEQLSVCVWIKANTQIPFGPIISFDETKQWSLSIVDSGQVSWITEDRELLTNFVINDYEWHHICAAYGPTSIIDGESETVSGNYRKAVYIDGKLDKTTSASSELGLNEERFGFIGAQSRASNFNGEKGEFYFKGIIDEVMIFNETLDQENIDFYYNDFLNENAGANCLQPLYVVSVRAGSPVKNDKFSKPGSITFSHPIVGSTLCNKGSESDGESSDDSSGSDEERSIGDEIMVGDPIVPCDDATLGDEDSELESEETSVIPCTEDNTTIHQKINISIGEKCVNSPELGNIMKDYPYTFNSSANPKVITFKLRDDLTPVKKRGEKGVYFDYLYTPPTYGTFKKPRIEEGYYEWWQVNDTWGPNFTIDSWPSEYMINITIYGGENGTKSVWGHDLKNRSFPQDSINETTFSIPCIPRRTVCGIPSERLVTGLLPSSSDYGSSGDYLNHEGYGLDYMQYHTCVDELPTYHTDEDDGLYDDGSEFTLQNYRIPMHEYYCNKTDPPIAGPKPFAYGFNEGEIDKGKLRENRVCCSWPGEVLSSYPENMRGYGYNPPRRGDVYCEAKPNGEIDVFDDKYCSRNHQRMIFKNRNAEGGINPAMLNFTYHIGEFEYSQADWWIGPPFIKQGAKSNWLFRKGTFGVGCHGFKLEIQPRPSTGSGLGAFTYADSRCEQVDYDEYAEYEGKTVINPYTNTEMPVIDYATGHSKPYIYNSIEFANLQVSCEGVSYDSTHLYKGGTLTTTQSCGENTEFFAVSQKFSRIRDIKQGLNRKDRYDLIEYQDTKYKEYWDLWDELDEALTGEAKCCSYNEWFNSETNNCTPKYEDRYVWCGENTSIYWNAYFFAKRNHSLQIPYIHLKEKAFEQDDKKYLYLNPAEKLGLGFDITREIEEGEEVRFDYSISDGNLSFVTSGKDKTAICKIKNERKECRYLFSEEEVEAIYFHIVNGSFDNFTLNITFEKMDYISDDEILVERNKKNITAFEQLGEKPTFLIDDNDYKDILQYVPVLMWQNQMDEDWCEKIAEGKCGYPYLIYHRESENLDPGIFLDDPDGQWRDSEGVHDSIKSFIENYKPDSVYGILTEESFEQRVVSAITLEKIHSGTKGLYTEHWWKDAWSENGAIIIMGQFADESSRYKGALLASTIASYMNAPIIYSEDVSRYLNVFKNKFIFQVGSCTECPDNLEEENVFVGLDEVTMLINPEMGTVPDDNLLRKYLARINFENFYLINPKDFSEDYCEKQAFTGVINLDSEESTFVPNVCEFDMCDEHLYEELYCKNSVLVSSSAFVDDAHILMIEPEKSFSERDVEQIKERQEKLFEQLDVILAQDPDLAYNPNEEVESIVSELQDLNTRADQMVFESFDIEHETKELIEEEIEEVYDEKSNLPTSGAILADPSAVHTVGQTWNQNLLLQEDVLKLSSPYNRDMSYFDTIRENPKTPKTFSMPYREHSVTPSLMTALKFRGVFATDECSGQDITNFEDIELLPETHLMIQLMYLMYQDGQYSKDGAPAELHFLFDAVNMGGEFKTPEELEIFFASNHPTALTNPAVEGWNPNKISCMMKQSIPRRTVLHDILGSLDYGESMDYDKSKIPYVFPYTSQLMATTYYYNIMNRLKYGLMSSLEGYYTINGILKEDTFERTRAPNDIEYTVNWLLPEIDDAMYEYEVAYYMGRNLNYLTEATRESIKYIRELQESQIGIHYEYLEYFTTNNDPTDIFDYSRVEAYKYNIKLINEEIRREVSRFTWINGQEFKENCGDPFLFDEKGEVSSRANLDPDLIDYDGLRILCNTGIENAIKSQLKANQERLLDYIQDTKEMIHCMHTRPAEFYESMSPKSITEDDPYKRCVVDLELHKLLENSPAAPLFPRLQENDLRAKKFDTANQFLLGASEELKQRQEIDQKMETEAEIYVTTMLVMFSLGYGTAAAEVSAASIALIQGRGITTKAALGLINYGIDIIWLGKDIKDTRYLCQDALNSFETPIGLQAKGNINVGPNVVRDHWACARAVGWTSLQAALVFAPILKKPSSVQIFESTEAGTKLTKNLDALRHAKVQSNYDDLFKKTGAFNVHLKRIADKGGEINPAIMKDYLDEVSETLRSYKASVDPTFEYIIDFKNNKIIFKSGNNPIGQAAEIMNRRGGQLVLDPTDVNRILYPNLDDATQTLYLGVGDIGELDLGSIGLEVRLKHELGHSLDLLRLRSGQQSSANIIFHPRVDVTDEFVASLPKAYQKSAVWVQELNSYKRSLVARNKELFDFQRYFDGEEVARFAGKTSHEVYGELGQIINKDFLPEVGQFGMGGGDSYFLRSLAEYMTKTSDETIGTIARITSSSDAVVGKYTGIYTDEALDAVLIKFSGDSDVYLAIKPKIYNDGTIKNLEFSIHGERLYSEANVLNLDVGGKNMFEEVENMISSGTVTSNNLDDLKKLIDDQVITQLHQSKTTSINTREAVQGISNANYKLSELINAKSEMMTVRGQYAIDVNHDTPHLRARISDAIEELRDEIAHIKTKTPLDELATPRALNKFSQAKEAVLHVRPNKLDIKHASLDDLVGEMHNKIALSFDELGDPIRVERGISDTEAKTLYNRLIDDGYSGEALTTKLESMGMDSQLANGIPEGFGYEHALEGHFQLEGGQRYFDSVEEFDNSLVDAIQNFEIESKYLHGGKPRKTLFRYSKKGNNAFTVTPFHSETGHFITHFRTTPERFVTDYAGYYRSNAIPWENNAFWDPTTTRSGPGNIFLWIGKERNGGNIFMQIEKSTDGERAFRLLKQENLPAGLEAFDRGTFLNKYLGSGSGQHLFEKVI